MKSQRGVLTAVPVRPPAAFWRTTQEIWDAGGAVLPFDDRWPAAESKRLLGALRPGRGPDGERADGLPAEEGMALVVATSGSTGAPKGVVLTRANLEASSAATRAALGEACGGGWLCCLPLNHIAGLMTLVRTRDAGLAPVIHEGFDPERVAGESGLCLALVPAMLKRLIDARCDLGRFPVILLGGGPVPAGLVERAFDAGGRVVASYGATETCSGVVYDGEPLPGARVEVGEGGEVMVAGGMVSPGYRLDPALSARAFAGGWFRTGDIGAVDGAGRVGILGRRDAMIITGGEKVSPEEVEAALALHPGLSDVAVAGVPDAEWGQAVTAVVVPAGPAPSPDEIRDFLRGSLAPHKLPRKVVVAPAIPRSPLGKPLRDAIAALAAGQQAGG